MSSSLQNWLVVDSRGVEGLGRGELNQSVHSPSVFSAQITLNNYESNCLRDWLSHRWKSASLNQTSLLFLADNALLVTLLFEEKNLIDAKKRFEGWLADVLLDREKAANSRR